jgi:hypothetical protein
MNKSVIMVTISLLLSAMAALAVSSFAEDGKAYLENIKSTDYQTRVDTLKKIEQAAIINQQLFDRIEANLLAGYKTIGNDREKGDEMGWYCNALASSGDKKYLPTLRLVASSSKISSPAIHCSQGADRLAFHRERVAAMIKPPIDKMSAEESLIYRMLKASEPKSIQFAVKKTIRANVKNERIYDAARDALMAGYLEKVNDAAHVDAMDWLCRCLAFSKMAKYRENLTQVHDKAQHWKLREYAGRSLIELGGSASAVSKEQTKKS